MSTPDLVRQLGRDLREDLPRYVQRLVPLLLVDYAPVSTAASDDLEAACVGNMGGIVDSLAGDTDGDPYASARATGVRRCRQGVPLELVLHAFRVGGRVLWDGMVEKSAGRRPDDPGNIALLGAAGAVWEVIDAHSSEVAAAYREEESRRLDSSSREAQALLTALVEGQGRDAAFVAAAAHRFGFPVAGPFVCVILQRAGETPHPGPPLRGSVLTAVWGIQGHGDVGLVVVPDGVDEVLYRELAATDGATVGVSPPFTALADFPSAHRLADLALRSLTSAVPPVRGTVARLDDRLVHALLLDNPEITSRVRDATVTPLLALGPYGQALLDTAEAFLACDASPAAAARLLPCHRNTVLHRLDRIAALTGMDLATHGHRLLWTLGLLSLGRDAALGPTSAPKHRTPLARGGAATRARR